MYKSRQKPLYRRNIFFRGVHGLETKVRHCRSMVRLFTYRRFQKRSTSLLWLQFSREQMTGIVACANAYHLFCVSTLRIEDMEALFACKENFCIRVNNIRHVAVLFDALLENTFILPHWQSVLDKGRFLLSKDGTRYVTASSLSSALSAARNNITSANLGIRKAISRLKI